MKKLVQATPEVLSANAWPRQDVPPQIEAIDSLVLGIKYTNKIYWQEPIYAKQIKYLIEIGEVMDYNIGLSGSQCITSPLILGKRSADEMLERSKRKVERSKRKLGYYYVASMITIGISTPITLADAIVIASAEILGGWIVAYNLDSEGEFIGPIISSIVNMRNGEVNFTGPETTLVDLGVKELFDSCFGGY